MSGLDRQISSMLSRNKLLLFKEEVASDLSSRTTQDPNVMDIDAIYLSSIERAEHMKHNKCFICHKVGCHTKNHPQDRPHNQGSPHPPRNPAWVRVTTTTPATTPTPKPKLKLVQFVGSLERKGTIKEEILWILAICFAEEDEGKVEIVVTAKIE